MSPEDLAEVIAPDESLLALVEVIRGNPGGVPAAEVLSQILLSTLRQEALLQQLVDLSTGATPKPSRSRRKAG